MCNGADKDDSTTIQETLKESEQLEAVAAITDDAIAMIEEVVADEGYHSRTIVHDLDTLGIRTTSVNRIAAPSRGRTTRPNGTRSTRIADGSAAIVTSGSSASARELLERRRAHLYGTGGLRRAHECGHQNVLKRQIVHAGGFNLGLWMLGQRYPNPRTLTSRCGQPKPRSVRLTRGVLMRIVLLTVVAACTACVQAPHREGPLPQFTGEYRILSTSESAAGLLDTFGPLARISSLSSRFRESFAGRLGTVRIRPTVGGEYAEWSVQFDSPSHEVRMIIGSRHTNGSLPVWRFEEQPAPTSDTKEAGGSMPIG